MKKKFSPTSVPALLALACAAACVPAGAEESASEDLEQVRVSVEKILESDEAKIFAEKMNLPPPDFQESVPVLSAEAFLEKFHGLPGFLRVGNALYSAAHQGPPFSFCVEEYENFSRARDYLIVRALFPLREGQSSSAAAEAVPVGTCGVSFRSGLGLCFIRGRVFVRVWTYGWKCDMSAELLEIARGIDALLCGDALVF